jgi:hypothetical protein
LDVLHRQIVPGKHFSLPESCGIQAARMVGSDG